MEHVHGEFLIEWKLLDTTPARVGILASINILCSFYFINNLASEKIVFSDLYQLHSLQFNQFLFISLMDEA